MRKGFTIQVLGTVLLAVAFPSARAADPVTLKIPCGTAPWPSCAELRTKMIDGVAGGTFPGGMKSVVREMLDDVYTAKVRTVTNAAGVAECTTFDRLNNPPLCSPLKIPENGCVDERTRAFKVPVGVDSTCPAISLVGAASNDHPLFSLGRSDTGSRESSNIAAGLLMAISNQGYEVSAEVATNALKIIPTSPCYQRALTLQQLIASQSDVKLVEQINACDPNDLTKSCSAKEYFKGDLAAILSGYLQIARCRLSDESTQKFAAFTADAGTPYSEVLRGIYVQQCFYPFRGRPSDMRACYKNRYESWITARSRAAFPHVAAGCP